MGAALRADVVGGRGDNRHHDGQRLSPHRPGARAFHGDDADVQRRKHDAAKARPVAFGAGSTGSAALPAHARTRDFRKPLLRAARDWRGRLHLQHRSDRARALPGGDRCPSYRRPAQNAESAVRCGREQYEPRPLHVR